MRISRYVEQLPLEVQEEMIRDVIEMLKRDGFSESAQKEIVENVKSEKLINVIGSEDGMLSYDKYSEWL